MYMNSYYTVYSVVSFIYLVILLDIIKFTLKCVQHFYILGDPCFVIFFKNLLMNEENILTVLACTKESEKVNNNGLCYERSGMKWYG